MDSVELNPAVTPSRWRSIGSAVLAAVIAVSGVFGAALVLLPRHLEYRVGEGELTVVTGTMILPRTRRWPLAAIGKVRDVRLHGGMRVFGTGMPGYCAGLFSYCGIGKVWQATDCGRNAVLLDIAGEPHPVVLSPPDRAAFQRAVAKGEEYRHVFGSVGSRAPWWWLIQLLMVLTVVLTVWVSALLLLGPGRLRYLLLPDALLVRTVFSTRRVPLAGLTARLEPSFRLGWRVWGVALPSYFAGLFRSSGTTYRIYATRSKGAYVILEGGLRPLGLTPADPEAFLDALRGFGVPVEGG